MLITSSIIAALGLVLFIYLQQAKFGRTPTGARATRIKQSPHYRAGKFQNLSHTPDLTEGVGYWAVLREFLFDKSTRSQPVDSLPSQKTNLLALAPDQNILVWFGHSSYFMQVDGKKILVDPVLCGSASPIASTTRSFPGTDVYHPDDLPTIDYLFISHDHWDHLDHQTLQQLRPKIDQVICGLGTGQHLEHWGFAPAQIIERDWDEKIDLDLGFVVHTAPARHFSGRGLIRNQSLWMSYVLQTPTMKIYLGGDSGYDTHFAQIGQAHGPFDLVILECGQYDKSWKYIHMMPEEVVQASIDLRAKHLLPVHWGKFLLANHAWDAPIIQVMAQAKARQVTVWSPMIGQTVNLKDSSTFAIWWENVR